MKLPKIIAVEKKAQLAATKCTLTRNCNMRPVKGNSVK